MGVIESDLKKLAAHYKCRLLLWVISLFLLIVGVLLFLVSLLSKPLNFTESTMGLTYLACLVIGLVLGLYLFSLLNRKVKSSKEVALLVEQVYPDLNESCISSLELELSAKWQNEIEKELIRRTSIKLNDFDLERSCLPNFLALKNIASVFIVALLLMGCVSQTSSFDSTRAYLTDYIQGKSSAILVTPGDVKIAQGTDLLVGAQVLRGDAKLYLETVIKGERSSVEMMGRKEGFELGLPHIFEDMTYRVFSATHSSDVFEVKVMPKPILIDYEIEVTPPAYTGEMSVKLKQSSKLAVLQGSELRIRIKAAETAKAYLSSKLERLHFTKREDSFTLSWLPNKDEQYTLELVSPEDISLRVHQFKVQVLGDQAPIITVLAPEKDGPIHKQDDLLFKAEVVDDYGLGQVNLMLSDSGGLEEMYTLYDKGLDKRVDVEELIKLRHLGLKEGDLLVAQFEALDKCSPKINKSRSKLYFFEVRPSLDDFEDQQESDSEGEKSISVQPIIVSARQLLREIYDLRSISPELGNGIFDANEERAHDISTRLAALNIDLKTIQKEVEGMGSAEMTDEFNSASKKLVSASREIEEKKLSAGIKDLQSALASLIRIDIELQKNTMKSRKPPKESSAEPQNQEKEEEGRLSEMLEKLEDLEAQQKELNEEKKESRAKAEEQKDLAKKTEQLSQQSQSHEGKQSLEQAQQQMQDAQQQMSQGESGQSSAQAALESLQKARQQMERAQKNQIRRKLKALAGQLSEKSKEQSALANKSSDLASKDRSERKALSPQLKAEQAVLAEQVGQLMDALSEGARQIEEDQPEFANALNKLRQEVTEQGGLASLKKASNALHYNLPGRAVKEQEKVSDILYETSLKLKDQIDSMPVATLEELLEMRQDLENVRQGMIRNNLNATGKESQVQALALEKLLSQMGEDLKNSELSFSLPQWLANQDFSKGGIRPHLQALQGANEVLDVLIQKAGLEQRISRSKRSGGAPENYRQMVKDYLKSLVEEK